MNKIQNIEKLIVLSFVMFVVVHAAASAQSTDGWTKPGYAADRAADDSLYYNQVVRMKDGRIIIGRVEYEEETDRYIIKVRNGRIETVLRRDVVLVEQHSSVYAPPLYSPSSPVYPCDIRTREDQWYFVELRAWLMYSGRDDSPRQIGLPEITGGPEVIAGLRFARHWGVGLGLSWFRAREINRYPFFLHGRYSFSLQCTTPFVYAQLGTVFDNQSGDYISGDKLFSPGPKIAGIGVGYDIAVTECLDLSADIGYRYLQLPTTVVCDCSDVPPLNEAVYYNESHGILLRLGVTF